MPARTPLDVTFPIHIDRFQHISARFEAHDDGVADNGPAR
jgi:hypothetical protein